MLGSSTEETGLFTNDSSTNPSFEQGESTHRFALVFRDPIDGIPVPGYSDDFCFKKVTIATEAEVGQTDPEWNNSNMIARSQSGQEVLLGPIHCGSSGN